jgi:pilus assembly protein Flp/PilA
MDLISRMVHILLANAYVLAVCWGWLKLFRKPARQPGRAGIASERGQGLVEYALILVLVAVAVIGVLLVMGPTIKGLF